MSTRSSLVAIFALAVTIFAPPFGVAPHSSRAAEGAPSAQDAPPAGALNGSPSLYLREAASGPVRWQPWSAATFALARKLHRPMLIDIGAVWCHWCHVMDQTTYSDPKVAALINRRFVAVKVDTDERPDIDIYYQTAAQRFSAGGWPLTCFTTPDGAPILIAGYLPPDASERRGMLWILDRVADAYAKDPNFTRLAHEIAAKIGKGESDAGQAGGSFDALRMVILKNTRAAFDEQAQGKAEGASFCDFPAVRMILAHGFFGHPEFTALAAARLKAIAAGGVYDQLGGGLHRYSTDANWRVPHFEKMAYDQAAAITAYAEAYEATGDADFARVAKSIIRYVNTTLLDSKSHTFYAHQDADAFAGDDGSYYTWTADEVSKLLSGRDAQVALMHFGFTIDPARAPDGRIVLRNAMSAVDIASKLHITTDQARAAITRAAVKMLAARERRRAPQVDTSILTERNALTASAYIRAAEAFGDDSLKTIALEDLDYLYEHSRAPDGSFYHALARGTPSVPGLAADQVYTMSAMLDAYQISGDRKYLDRASSLGAMVFAKFRDPASGLLRNRAPATPRTVLTDAALGAQVFYDDPVAAAQAVAAESFQILAALTSDSSYRAKAQQLLSPALPRIGALGGPNNGALGFALEQRWGGEAVVAIAGPGNDPRTAQLTRTALAAYRPGKVVVRPGLASDESARVPDAMKAMFETAAHRMTPLAFVCADTACANPAGSADALTKTIRDFGVNRASAGNLATR